MANVTAMSITEETGRVAPGWTADASTFGARLALIRQRMGWGNIAKAAKECGVPTDSWRNWEVDGREPHRMVTIAMTIATKTGCDLDWLVYGPGPRPRFETRQFRAHRVVATMGQPPSRSPSSDDVARPTDPVRRTRPIVRVSSRPDTPVAA